MPDQWQGSLDELVANGCATIAGEDPLGSAPERRSLICDAVVTQFDVPSLWIGVYAVRGPAEGSWLQVQQVELLVRVKHPRSGKVEELWEKHMVDLDISGKVEELLERHI
jgi:hypothetical protein